ncbi:MAG: ACT domain-containing protein [Lachnospiraceae bacterium]|nr:ACT domain-containing protein [Lachnospiraceae bacterium]
MKIEPLGVELSVCKVVDYSMIDLNKEFCFTGKTDVENSLVCPLQSVPENVVERDDGWRAFRICGMLDFSLIGILSGISSELERQGIGIFAISTFNTDYVLVKENDFDKALESFSKKGYNCDDRGINHNHPLNGWFAQPL